MNNIEGYFSLIRHPCLSSEFYSTECKLDTTRTAKHWLEVVALIESVAKGVRLLRNGVTYNEPVRIYDTLRACQFVFN